MRIGLLVAVCLCLAASAAQARNGTCVGCACHGGSGYRGSTGCVKEKAVKRVCGEPATLRCTFDGESREKPKL